MSPKEIKFEMMPSEVGHSMQVNHIHGKGRDFVAGERAPEFRVTREILPIQWLRLATQEVRVAFDPETHTLYIGERGYQRGWLHAEVQRLSLEADRTRSLAKRAGELLKSRKPGQRRRGRKLLAQIAAP